MKIQARLQDNQSADRRGFPRRTLLLGSSIVPTGHDVSIHDLSATGMLIETAAELAPFDDLEIELPEGTSTHAVVVWNSGRFFGCEFKNALSKATVSAALLRGFPSTASQLELSLPAQLDEPQAQQLQDDFTSEEEKAPLKVRLRVIFGSAILLWALIIWAVMSLI